MSEVIRIDAMGEPCPIPVVKAIRALDGAAAGTHIEILVDNETAVQNLLRMGRNRQCPCQDSRLGEKQFMVQITACASGGAAAVPPGTEKTGRETARAPGGTSEAPDGTSEAPDGTARAPGHIQKGTVAVISSPFMGVGDEALGRTLLKGFLYALSNSTPLPETVLFYNGGIMLTTEGSESLEDLSSMEEQGVAVLSCGTCLDFYKRKDLLRAGTVTDMYTITETLMQANKIIRP